MFQIPTLYTNYQELLLDLDILGKILSESAVNRDELKSLLFEEYKITHPLPTLEDKRYELSDLVSSDYHISYANEIELAENEQLVDLGLSDSSDDFELEGNIIVPESVREFYRHDNITDEIREKFIEEFLSSDTEDFAQEDIIDVEAVFNTVESHASTYIEGYSDDEEDYSDDRVGYSDDEDYSEESDDEDYSNDEKEESEDDYSDDEDYSGDDYSDDEEDYSDDDEDDYSGDDYSDDEEDYSDDEDYSNDEEDESDADYFDDEDYSEESDDDEDYSNELDDDEDYSNDEDYSEESEDDEDYSNELDDDEDYSNELDDDEDYSEESEDAEDYSDDEDYSEEPVSSLNQSTISIKKEDSYSFTDNNSSSDIEFEDFTSIPAVEVPTPIDIINQNKRNSTQVIEQPKTVVNREDEPKDLREFIRKHPRCEVSFALQYFSRKEIEKYIMMGKVIKKGTKLHI